MPFQEDFDRHAETLLRLTDAGVRGRAAALALGISSCRVWEILQACGRGAGPRKVITDDQRERVMASFAEHAKIEAAARAGGCDHKTARRILVRAGHLSATTAPVARPVERARWLELVEAGMAPVRAAREVGVHENTGRRWAREARESGRGRATRRVDADGAGSAPRPHYTIALTSSDVRLSRRSGSTSRSTRGRPDRCVRLAPGGQRAAGRRAAPWLRPRSRP